MRITLIAAPFVALVNAALAPAQVFVPLGYLPNAAENRGYSVSMNGSVVSGSTHYVGAPDRTLPTAWSGSGVPASLPLPPPLAGASGVAFGVSGDGTTIVGEGFSGATYRALRWITSGVQDIGPGAAYAASFDGSVIVGASTNAFRWTQSGGMTDLGHLPGVSPNMTVAFGVNGDGSVVVGYSGSTAFRWMQADGMKPLPNYPGGNGAEARGVSADGSRIAGRVTLGIGVTDRAALWVGDIVEALDPTPGSSRSEANSISPDGRLLVGLSGGFGDRATVWDTALKSTYDLKAYLNSQGLDIGAWTLLNAAAITGDNDVGYNIVGIGFNPQGPPQGYLITGLHFTPLPEPTGFILAGTFATWIIVIRHGQRNESTRLWAILRWRDQDVAVEIGEHPLGSRLGTIDADDAEILRSHPLHARMDGAAWLLKKHPGAGPGSLARTLGRHEDCLL